MEPAADHVDHVDHDDHDVMRLRPREAEHDDPCVAEVPFEPDC